MRILMIHVSNFTCAVTSKGRSPVIEEPESKEISTDEAIVVLAAVERDDEESPDDVGKAAAKTIADHCAHLKVDSVVVCSFAHLFTELAAAQVAVYVLGVVAEQLRERGLSVEKTPFGWFNSFEMKAKGHPLSRVARVVSPSLG